MDSYNTSRGHEDIIIQSRKYKLKVQLETYQKKKKEKKPLTFSLFNSNKAQGIPLHQRITKESDNISHHQFEQPPK